MVTTFFAQTKNINKKLGVSVGFFVELVEQKKEYMFRETC
jgi:hypothetical protein